MKVYIAAPLCTKPDREFAEKLDKLCKKLKLETFLPHRDAGLWKKGISFKEIAKKDTEAIDQCQLIIASLNGFNVGAGTAYEMGIAFAKKIPIIAIKSDRKPKESIEEISAIIIGNTKITECFKELEEEIKKLV